MAVDRLQELLEDRAKVFDELEDLQQRQDEWTDLDGVKWGELSSRFDHMSDEIDSIYGRDRRDSAVATARMNGDDEAGKDRTHEFRDHHGNTVRTKSWHEPLQERDRRIDGEGDEVRIERILPAFLRNDYATLSDAERRNLLGGQDDSFLLSTVLGNQLYDLARPRSVILRAGGQSISMRDSSMKLIRVTADPTIHWRPEYAAVNTSSPTFDAILLEPKTVACIVPISNELLEDASNMGSILTQVITARMGQAIDEAALKGAGVRDPLGLRNLGTLNAIGSVGTPADYNHISSAIGDVMAANYPGSVSDLAWVSHPRDDDVIDQLQDSTNQPLQPTPRVAQVMRFSTTSIATDEGGGSDESYAVVGDFSQVIIAMRTNLQVRVTADGIANDGTSDISATSQLLRFFIAYMRLDVAVVRPTWLTLLTGITTS